MTDEVEVIDTEQKPEIDIQALLAENEKLKQDLKVVVDHKDKLYQETKKAKADRAQADQEAKRIAEEKALKDGEFEKLWKTAKQREDELANELKNIKTSNRQEKIQLAAMKIASELSEGVNVELLSDFVSRNLDKLADETGLLSNEVFDEVKQDFASNEKYKSLMKVSKATGGSAPGNQRGAQVDRKEVDRQTFFKMNAEQQMKHINNGGTVTG